MSTTKKKAVFLDRDNTLIEDPGYISHPSQVKLLPGTAASLTHLRKMDFMIVVVSNQSGVARGIVTEEVLAQIHHQLEKLLADEGAFLDGIYYCPYHPDGVIEKYRMESDLRKPAPGMLLQAAEEMNIDLSCSWMIGDSYRDIEAGRRAGCKTILINNPIKPVVKNPVDPEPDRQAVNIREAVNIIRMYELRQSMEASREHKSQETPESQSQQEISVPATDDSALLTDKSVPSDIQPSNAETLEDITDKMKPSNHKSADGTADAAPEIPTEPLYQKTHPVVQVQPLKPVEQKMSTESVKPQAIPSIPSKEADQPSKTENLLQELLSHMKSIHRSRQYEDFTISKVAAGAAQFLAIVCLIVSLWPIIDSTTSSDWILILLGYAAVLQLMAIAFYIMRER